MNVCIMHNRITGFGSRLSILLDEYFRRIDDIFLRGGNSYYYLSYLKLTEFLQLM